MKELCDRNPGRCCVHHSLTMTTTPPLSQLGELQTKNIELTKKSKGQKAEEMPLSFAHD